MLQNGKYICRKYCLNDIEQVDVLEKRLREMKGDLVEKKELELDKIAEAQSKLMKIHGKIRALEIHQKEIDAAREYLRKQSDVKTKEYSRC